MTSVLVVAVGAAVKEQDQLSRPGAAEAGAATKKRCILCPHQRIRSQCKECGGVGICPHQRRRSKCKECGGASICQHQRQRSHCKECGGGSLSTGRVSYPGKFQNPLAWAPPLVFYRV